VHIQLKIFHQDTPTDCSCNDEKQTGIIQFGFESPARNESAYLRLETWVYEANPEVATTTKPQ